MRNSHVRMLLAALIFAPVAWAESNTPQCFGTDGDVQVRACPNTDGIAVGSIHLITECVYMGGPPGSCEPVSIDAPKPSVAPNTLTVTCSTFGKGCTSTITTDCHLTNSCQ